MTRRLTNKWEPDHYSRTIIPNRSSLIPHMSRLMSHDINEDCAESHLDQQKNNTIHINATEEKINVGPPPNSQLNGVNVHTSETSVIASTLDEDIIKLPESPHLSFRKFLTMQEKRVVVTIIYTEKSGLRPFFITAARRIKAAQPDVLIVKRVLPLARPPDRVDSLPGHKAVFEIQIDGKRFVSNMSNKRLSNSVSSGTPYVYIPMKELENSLLKARKKKRPATFYGSGNNPKESVRLEMLDRKSVV